MKFRRQHPIGSFITDYCCLARRLVVELDGPVHLSTRQRDVDRTEMLTLRGYRVLRFTNERALDDLAGVLREIAKACKGQIPTGD